MLFHVSFEQDFEDWMDGQDGFILIFELILCETLRLSFFAV
jgi:hypothetical protein